MDKEDILKKAIERYPVGTIFKGADKTSEENYIIDDGDYIDWYSSSSKELVLYNRDGSFKKYKELYPVIYSFHSNPEWAPIIFKPVDTFKLQLEEIRKIIYED